MRSGSRRWADLIGRREGSAPTFLLGAGAHLAGVTALHRYLAASPQCEAGDHREYHVLDSAGLASEQWVREELLDQAERSLDQVRRQGRASGRALQRAAMIADPEVYFDHFTGLLARPGIRLTMDLTPEHSMLDAEQLAAVREGFVARGVRVASVFVMRDPLDRIVTHLRLQRQQRPADYPGSLEHWVGRLYDDPVYARRTRYDRTVTALDEVFDPADVWFGFHERMHSPDSSLALTTLCRIDHHDPTGPTGPKRPHADPTAGLPESLARTVVEHYREVYDFVTDRFGLHDLSTLWPSARLAP